MIWSRRHVLKAGGVLAGVAAGFGSCYAQASRHAQARGHTQASGHAQASRPPDPVKRIALLNLHTAERLDLVFYRGQTYVPESLAAIDVLMRDFRNGERHAIDPSLMDYLFEVAATLGVDPVFSVISGYRSPQTNEQLRERSRGVARHSLHLEGRAIDVRLTGVNCADLAMRAQGMSRGGVGYYRKSDFVHLDTGACRTWRG